MLPKDWARLTHSDYVNLCVGYFDKMLRDERIERQAQWFAYAAVADFKKNPTTIEKWWPIRGDKQAVVKMPSRKRLLQIEQWVKNLGNKK